LPLVKRSPTTPRPCLPTPEREGLIGRPSDARLKNNHRNSISCGRRGPAARSCCNSTWHNPRVSAALAAPPIEKSFTLVIDDACSKSCWPRSRRYRSRSSELLRQFESGHLGHSYIEQQVAALSRVVICDERAGRWKTLPQSTWPRSINRSPCLTARLHAAPNGGSRFAARRSWIRCRFLVGLES
jgi:hypothetical protein